MNYATNAKVYIIQDRQKKEIKVTFVINLAYHCVRQTPAFQCTPSF